MTPKEKALELTNSFVTKSVFEMSNEELKTERVLAKRNALICVDLLIEEESNSYYEWIEVKKEIEKL